MFNLQCSMFLRLQKGTNDACCTTRSTRLSKQQGHLLIAPQLSVTLATITNNGCKVLRKGRHIHVAAYQLRH